jgi:hypothetical protein
VRLEQSRTMPAWPTCAPSRRRDRKRFARTRRRTPNASSDSACSLPAPARAPRRRRSTLGAVPHDGATARRRDALLLLVLHSDDRSTPPPAGREILSGRGSGAGSAYSMSHGDPPRGSATGRTSPHHACLGVAADWLPDGERRHRG